MQIQYLLTISNLVIKVVLVVSLVLTGCKDHKKGVKISTHDETIEY